MQPTTRRDCSWVSQPTVQPILDAHLTRAADVKMRRRAAVGEDEQAVLSSETPRFSVLCVCTGNICRSPAAQLLLADRFGPTVAVSSAGTHALVGQPVSPPMARLLEDGGTDSTVFVARRLTEALLKPADLVLTMTRAHRTDVMDLRPAAVRRTFTLREFARLIQGAGRTSLPDGDVVERLRAAIPLAASRRRQVLDPVNDDVADPYRQSTKVYIEALGEIRQAVEAIAEVIQPG